MRWALLFILIPQIALGAVGEIGKIKGSGALERGSESIEAINGVGVQTMDTALLPKVECKLTSLMIQG